MICIATPNSDAPETFIQQHIRKIAPGNTAVLYFHGTGESLSGNPSLRVIQNQNMSWVERRYLSFANMVTYAYPGAISSRANKVVEKFLKEHKVRSILAEFGPTGCALLPICRELGIRLVVNFHGHDATVMPKRWVIRHAYRNLNKYADALVCGSKHFSEVMVNIGFDKEKIHIVPCGIELDQFRLDIEKDPNLIIAVGRFVEKKAPHLTIQAFQMVLAKCPNARLEMIGDGPLMNACQEIIRKNNLENKVILRGAKSHEFVKQRLAVASLFVQHSVVASNGDTESQGISLLEAMASEVPVVSTRHNGFVETVVDGVTGFLVEERDVVGMAQKIIKLLQESQLCNQMGKAGRVQIRANFEAEQQANRLRNLLLS